MNDATTAQNSACISCLIPSCIDRLCSTPSQISRWFDSNIHGLAPIFPRLLLAYEFGEAGLEKLQGDNWFADLIFPFPFNLLPADFSWTLATGLEIIAPIALILGFMTRFFSAALMVLTVVAIAAVHWPAEWQTLAELWKGYAVIDKGYGNFKLPLSYLFMLSSLVLSGSGRLGIDNWLKNRASSNQGYGR
ncbi:DoxX family protein [Methylomonas sp. EFPC1]|uniref:HvfX family Cu-binding RiPP maturation protein n=1 Tax=Methylomonas sp. EFPC1 TaxID=2812647 RepID=UPI0019682D17|nr:DoxX family protein [Methylomonas sp. EFPC1]QSA99809.1 DoxX family protein [Methylomonas sp. EFPC1]